MQLFYSPDISNSEEYITFSKEESRHIVKVLRKKTGDLLQITNGNGFLYSVEIEQAHDKKCTGRIRNFEEKPRERLYYLHVAIAPTKLNDRMEWFLEKATEIGIDEITPIRCDRSERKEIKHERMEKVIISAMKQSLKFRLPKLNPTMGFREFIKKCDWDLGLIAHCEEGDKTNLRNFLPFKKRILILIGPEGDFSPREIEEAQKLDIKPVSLGKSRLRTETAGIVACHTVSVFNEEVSNHEA
ncbi:16S rRNA (uracil(1498)-N(3))-methyltransferase [Lutimonas saemankumensis]|uniref:16S rRNA (uracil(1498)-N(3))-methyltransferase n=1 Tax=Lutimonas saemankumensis TaxID=483016 RepID=UPI001CD31B0A|nr:16S rRNA (uracil(1498)-N(3))-methyltransferase [Lutimonas saemankumensis]MCA0933786.1 16S rRNA (uracil(1498)-N(3))-methyltransferase [Lutimonas saemankumensis]